MKKLLHERLREFASILDDDDYTFRFEDGNFTDLELNEAESLADEIEKYYIPLPRYEDGEPVEFGECKICWNDTGEYNPQVPWRVTAISQDGVPIATAGATIVSVAEMADGGFVKRFTEVLDADGVELHVGETPYYISDGSKAKKIVSLCKARTKHPRLNEAPCRDYVLYEDGWDYAHTLIHEKPVFDANGERICKGDTVWNLDTLEKLFVVEFANRECGLVQCSNEEDGTCEDYSAHQLTHREPDSYEKLRDDLDEFMRDCEINEEVIDHYINRLTALMERDA